MLTPDQVYQVLTSDASQTALAYRLKVSRSTITQIRAGKLYPNIHPDIERVKNRSCSDCNHYCYQRCTMGFPEAEHPQFAKVCNAYAGPDTIEPVKEINRAGAHCKLSPEDVQDIRLVKGREATYITAQRYGVARKTINKVQSGDSFKWLPWP